MSHLQNIRDWCEEKGSPWFTKKDAKRILDYMHAERVENWLRGWEARGDIKREKGSRWYKMSFVNRYPSLYATETVGVAVVNLKAVVKVTFEV